MESAYGDLGRPPLHEGALQRALVRDGGLWREVRVVAETGSTNADLAARARDGAPEGTVLVTELQTAGRGRQGRTWTAPARSGLAFSMLLRPAVPVPRLGWASLLTGVAVAMAIRRMTAWSQTGEGFLGDREDAAVDVALKWPNDVLVGRAKVGGLLLESSLRGAGPAVEWLVLGIGVNVASHPRGLPYPATSLAAEGAPGAGVADVLEAVVARFAAWRAIWQRRGFAPVRAAWLRRAHRLGEPIRVRGAAGGAVRAGRFAGLDEHGALLLERTDGRREPLYVGDAFPLEG